MNGRLFIISAPSGAGKTTLLQKVMEQTTGLAFSISHTTREPRPKEKDGVDYHFVSRKEFLSLQEKGVFLESAEVHNNFYGTSGEVVLKQLAEGIDVILDIDVQGAEILRKDSSLDAAFIFIAPPSLAELERRLRQRQTEDEATCKLRVENARKELKEAAKYHYLLVNDDLEEAVVMLRAIILAERAGQHRGFSGQSVAIEGINGKDEK
ncbi:guanylate kinase [candidate division KSB3 bacterium]|uniref:Guanylate kinase n=1 Tax=candidate division KSB3 bacterium TaxID=2044937 RepID=A0A2G6E0N2_9BACT|nr:MAG: guanylate kinase [candidate division KSB3 bacterium]